MIDISCPSCTSKKIVYVGDIPSSIFFAGKVLGKPLSGGRLYQCRSCYLYFRWPSLSTEHLADLYQDAAVDNWQYNPEDRKDWQIATFWLNANLGSGSILDIGCFDGGFLKYIGRDWGRYGIEIHEIATTCAEAHGIHIIAKNFAEIAQLSRQFDAIAAFDVIEHVKDPRNFLQQMAAITRSEGIIIISTGNTDAPSWKFMGSRYWYCVIAEHISFINKKWCNTTAQALNLQIQHVERFSHAGKNRNVLRIASQLSKNTFYKFFPHWFGWFRSIGMGKIDTTKFTELKKHPPSWMSAKDHFIVVFKKT